MCNSLLRQALLAIYRILWAIATPLLLRSPRLRHGAAERLLQDVKFSKVNIWIHAASVGEAYIASQIIHTFDKSKKLSILITTNTAQGKEILKKELSDKHHTLYIAYMVFDNPSLVKKAVAIADPDLLVLIELEIWPALMAEIKQCGKKIIIVNGRMTEKSFKGYKKIACLWRMLKPDTILAISEMDKKRLQTLFKQPATYFIPNMKFDKMKNCHISDNNQTNEKSLILASIRKEEETEVLYVIKEIIRTFPALHIDLFPRHLHRVSHWEGLLTEENITHTLKTSGGDEKSCSVVIWDVFGELTNAYKRADAVFVGGSLAPLGGQNFIEAFMNGVTPVTGPYISNFLWAGEEVFAKGLVHKGSNKEEVVKLLIDILQNPIKKSLIQKKADNYIQEKQGGSRKTCQHIVALLGQDKEGTHSEPETV